MKQNPRSNINIDVTPVTLKGVGITEALQAVKKEE
jgi:hypothetical protein